MDGTRCACWARSAAESALFKSPEAARAIASSLLDGTEAPLVMMRRAGEACVLLPGPESALPLPSEA